MTSVTLVRHFETEWNRQGRIQGRSDQPLADDVGAKARHRRPVTIGPKPLPWFTSPLRRATETATLLGCRDAARDSRLNEMDWGRWEGKRLQDLRATLGKKMARNESRGLDFRPDGGESPREVSERVKVQFQVWPLRSGELPARERGQQPWAIGEDERRVVQR